MRTPLVFSYHDVSPTLRLTGNRVYPSQFKHHVEFLTSHFSPLQDLNCPLLPDSFLITFDDAFVGVLEYALPIMERYDLKGLVFVVTGYVGRKSHWDAHFGTPAVHLDAEGLRTLLKAGWILGSHTVNHKALPLLSDHEIERELEFSKKWLEDLTGHEVIALAYPFNMYDYRTVRIAHKVGYKVAFAGPSLRSSYNCLSIPRIPVFLPDLSLRPKLHRSYALIDMLLTAPARLSPLYQSLLHFLKKVV
ncbi:MAG: polysaccharide deacetylase family protein [Thermotogae bacterium]|nr:polysaccharide deacetylase family protein [Thermotogota bacterium]